MWKEGCILVNHRRYHYWIKQWDTGSKFGINGGRISKLMIKRGGEAFDAVSSADSNGRI